MDHRPRELRRRAGGGTSVSQAAGRTTSEAPPELALQRSAGNRAVADLIEGAQPKLAVGRVDDPLEHEADAVAAEVVDAVRTGSVTATLPIRPVRNTRTPTPTRATCRRA